MDCLASDTEHFEQTDLGSHGAAYALLFLPPTAALVAPRAGSLPPPRPPASLAYPAPTVTRLEPAASRITAGDTLTLRVRWSAPSVAGLDPRGYRLRVELVVLAESASFWRAAPRRVWRLLMSPLVERGRATGIEIPLAGGLPTARWSGGGEEVVRLPIPRWFGPGSCELRARALPGPFGADRVRGGASILPPATEPAVISVLAPGVSP